MPHELTATRDRINALIGPIEQIVSDLNDLRLDGGVDPATFAYTMGGLEQAMEVLQGTVSAIDDYEEPEPDEPEADEPEPDDDDDAAEEDDEDEEA